MRNVLPAVAVALVLGLVSVQQVSGAVRSSPVIGSQWKAVISDWLAHDRFAVAHSCAAVVVARSHAPPRFKEGSALVHALDLYENSRCGGWVGSAVAVRVGMSDQQVVAIAGPPVPWRSGPNCWWYRKPGDGRGVCFGQGGYVDRILIAAHG